MRHLDLELEALEERIAPDIGLGVGAQGNVQDSGGDAATGGGSTSRASNASHGSRSRGSNGSGGSKSA